MVNKLEKKESFSDFIKFDQARSRSSSMSDQCLLVGTGKSQGETHFPTQLKIAFLVNSECVKVAFLKADFRWDSV